MRPYPACRLMLAVLALLGLFATGPAGARAAAAGPYRIGYLESGPYWTTDQTFAALKANLARRGWEQRVEFVADAHYSPGWDSGQKALEKAARALMARDDLDLILVMGTQASRTLLAVNNGRTPILGLDITDPVGAGLVKGPQESGTANFTTLIQQDLWTDMFHLFHEAVGFKRLGLIMTNDPDSLVWSHLNAAREVARDRGFALETYSLDGPSSPAACEHGIDELIARGIDAFFLPILPCLDLDNIATVLDTLNRHKVATFASEGSLLIKKGALMGASTHNFTFTGEISAGMFIAMLQGQSPDSLRMLYRVPPAISLNLETAAQVGIDFPFNLLSVCDEIYCQLAAPASPGS